MRFSPKLPSVLIAGLLLGFGSNVEAVTITHGGDSVDIDFVDIGNAGNTADTTGYGAVDYQYSIGKFEVTADQWATVTGFDALIENNSNESWSGSQPTANVSWLEAAKFANWLTTGDALMGAYQFSDAATFIGLDREAALYTYGTVYVLPSEDEWYKAAYLKSDGGGYTLYATGDSLPVAGTDAAYDGAIGPGPWTVGNGSIENNGTYDMGGNVFERLESALDGTLDDPLEDRVVRGGGYAGPSTFLQSSGRPGGGPPPDAEDIRVGFRVASLNVNFVPEPSSLALLGLGGLTVLLRRRR